MHLSPKCLHKRHLYFPKGAAPCAIVHPSFWRGFGGYMLLLSLEKKARPENTSEMPHETAARRVEVMTVIFDGFLALFCTSISWLKAAPGAEPAV